MKIKSKISKIWEIIRNKENNAISQPYIVQYKNTTDKDLEAFLFGFNDVFDTENFGNPKGIEISCLNGSSYRKLYCQSSSNPFKIGKWRFQSENIKQLQQRVILNESDANGVGNTNPINLAIMHDAYQPQLDIVDVCRVFFVDANSIIKFKLLANTTFLIAMFPIEIAENKNPTFFQVPRLSGKNVAPVVIVSHFKFTLQQKLEKIKNFFKKNN